MTCELEEIEIKNLDHLGIVAGIIDDIGIVELVNELLGTDSRENINCGQVVKAIILNGLGFVSRPLYLFSNFFQDKAVENLLGAGTKAEDLNDDKLGRVMDKLYKYGLTKIFLFIGLEVIKKHGISTKFSHLDSTSFHLHGQYKNQKDQEIKEKRLEVIRENPIFITEGYSRDHRSDLKQCVLDLIVSSDGDIPIFIRGGSGNESDKAMFGKIFAEYSQQIDFESIMIADSALYSAKNLILIEALKWISRVPLSIKKAKNLVKATKSEELEESESKGYKYLEVKVTYGGIDQRWMIVESAEVTSLEVLTAYKQQQSCERGFRFLKDPLFFTDSLYIKNPERIETMMMLMGLSLLVYTIGQREIRNNLERSKSFIKNQVNKLIQRPTLRWIFQCFQGIHCFKLEGVERISNLSEERCRILKFLPIACQKYYLIA